jgi:hypothetical protein
MVSTQKRMIADRSACLNKEFRCDPPNQLHCALLADFLMLFVIDGDGATGDEHRASPSSRIARSF